MSASTSLAPPPLRAATHRARVTFDGTTVSITRRLNPVPGWRTKRHSLDSILSARYIWLGGEGEHRAFELRLLYSPTIRIAIHIGMRRRRNAPWEVLEKTINEASGQRMRHILRGTVGLGPWREEVWRQVESLSPELHVFAETNYDAHMPSRKLQSHREMIARLVLEKLSKDGIETAPSPYPPPAQADYPPHASTWNGLPSSEDIWPPRPSDPLNLSQRWRSEVLLVFLDRIKSREIIRTTDWAQDASALLAWGHHYRAALDARY